MKTRFLIISLLSAVTGGCIVLFGQQIFRDKPQTEIQDFYSQTTPQTNYVPVNFSALNDDFSAAAEKSIHSVVHVKTQYARAGYDNPLYEFFFGNRNYVPQPIEGYGSGVIISSDGYIITNNHVIERSDYIEVILNDKRSYQAKLIGTDPFTDIALLKIEEDDLAAISYGDSDNLKIGEWVLAAGNPFNLTSTVTAGIVSAKARNIDVLNQEYAIESFIQTDAAVNPGNSGGALVNTRGELVGINTAIASRTGSFSGYSFAIPVNIAKKVVSDLIEYGSVQRALLGVSIRDLDARGAKYLGIDKIEGVYISKISVGGAAEKAGIESGDIIISINKTRINKVSELQEQISKFRPGDKISLEVRRDDKLLDFEVVLQNKQGSTNIIRSEVVGILGAKFEDLPDKELAELGIEHGVRVTSLEAGKLLKAGVKEGFVITFINRQSVSNVNDIKAILNNADGGVYLEGIYPNGVTAYYAFGLNK